MKLKTILFPISFVVLSFVNISWGFYGHKKINRTAVFTLPKSISGFYKKHINSITENAPNPDKRRYIDSTEAPKHYIDLDHYGKTPRKDMPKLWKDACAKYSEKMLLEYGIVPWQIQRSYYQLVNAFKEKNTQKIIRISADLGHYIADAHVPLHTSENYNGQLSGQKGIHALWESRLPEMHGHEYNLYVGKAKYLDSPLNTAWETVYQSFECLDSVLSIEKKLREKTPEKFRESIVIKNNKITRNYSDDYAKKYHDQLNGMVERRMRAASLAVGCFWYSAWVDAGQPDLEHNTPTSIDTLEQRKVDIAFKNNPIIGRSEGYED